MIEKLDRSDHEIVCVCERAGSTGGRNELHELL